jgi:hypothetical protein
MVAEKDSPRLQPFTQLRFCSREIHHDMMNDPLSDGALASGPSKLGRQNCDFRGESGAKPGATGCAGAFSLAYEARARAKGFAGGGRGGE